MKWISVLLIAVMALVPSATLWPASAEAQPQRNAGSITVPVTGTAVSGEAFAGMFTITKFAVQEGKLVALGTLVGTVGGTSTGITTIAMPVDTLNSGGATKATGFNIAQLVECDILHLVLGPLDVNLLGLVIHLDRVVLDITAQPGAGNLLGNLLCAIVGLLDPLGPLTGLAALLNQLLAILGGL